MWLLGSSLYSAQLAAQLGLPFAFASHFAPDMLFQALHLYRSNFKPSARLEKPYAMVCINIIAADSNRDAEFLFTSMQQAFVKLRRGETGHRRRRFKIWISSGHRPSSMACSRR